MFIIKTMLIITGICLPAFTTSLVQENSVICIHIQQILDIIPGSIGGEYAKRWH